MISTYVQVWHANPAHLYIEHHPSPRQIRMMHLELKLQALRYQKLQRQYVGVCAFGDLGCEIVDCYGMVLRLCRQKQACKPDKTYA